MIFFTDLDGTMIFSHRLVNESNKDLVYCVEYYNGKPITYMTYSAIDKMKQLPCVIPVTTRSIEQFKRVEFFNNSEYAVACNGGIILHNGSVDEKWSKHIDSIVAEYDLGAAQSIFNSLPKIISKPKIVDQIFVFAKSESPELCIEILKAKLNTKIWEFVIQGQKVYAIPKTITKRNAVKYICEQLLEKNQPVISAGDTTLDISMLEYTDYSIVPGDSKIALLQNDKFIRSGSGIDSADEILKFVLDLLHS